MLRSVLRYGVKRSRGGVGASQVVPVDLHIRGCPPDPVALLKGLLALLEPERAEA